MARINTHQLVKQAIEVGQRANYVREDPAVQKAAKQAVHDVRQAAASTATLAAEAASSWRRSR